MNVVDKVSGGGRRQITAGKANKRKAFYVGEEEKLLLVPFACLGVVL